MNPSPDIYIYFSIINPDMPDTDLMHYLQQLPYSLRPDVLRYHQKADRIRTLTGKLLLKEALQQAGLSPVLMDSIRYTDYKRPYVSNELDFNITHSGCCVACVAGRDMKVGIDVEELKPISPDEIATVFRDDELDSMKGTNASPETILRFWTRKEAIVKASGEGFHLPPQSVYFIDELTATTPTGTWFLHELNLGNEYIAYCATNVEGSRVRVKRIEYV